MEDKTPEILLQHTLFFWHLFFFGRIVDGWIFHESRDIWRQTVTWISEAHLCPKVERSEAIRVAASWGTRRAKVDWRKESEVKGFSCWGSLRTKSPTCTEGEENYIRRVLCLMLAIVETLFVVRGDICSHWNGWNTQQVTWARAKFISGSDAGKSLEEDGSEDWLLQPLLATLRERRKVLWYNIFLQKVSCFDVLMSPDVCVTI